MLETATAVGAPVRPQFGDFERVAVDRLNPSARCVQAMSWFNDQLILGTARAPLRARKGAASRDRSDGDNEEHGAQILAFDPVTRDWHKLFDSPLAMGTDGLFRTRDRAIRTSLVCRAASDPAPCLYMATSSLSGNVVFLRSENGRNIEECGGVGFGQPDADIASTRAMACLDGRLFASPMGKNRGGGRLDEHLTDLPVVFVTDNPRQGNWAAASEPGFGDASNLAINELTAFAGRLYAATVNPRYGFQLWFTDAEGPAPFHWHKLIDRGAWSGASNAIPGAMSVFGDALYVTCGMQRHGHDGLDRVGPYPAEIIRIYADGRWDVVCGAARFSPHGLKRPVSGLPGGFGDWNTHGFPRMSASTDQILVGTSGWRWMPTYLRNRTDLSDGQYNKLREASEAGTAGEFSLWRSLDGDNWEAVTHVGLRGTHPTNYGVRDLLSTPHGVFLSPLSTADITGEINVQLWLGHIA